MGSRSRRIKVGGLVVVGALVGSTALERPSVRPMDFTGRPMRGFVFVGPEALGTDRKLRSWVMRGARYAGGLPRKPAKGAR
jgi:hypothetical protein